MAKQVIDDAWVTLNSVDLSTRVKKVSLITNKRSPQLVTAMGQSDEEYIPVNIKGFKVNIEFYQDFASGSVYETMKGILNSTATSGVPIIIRPTTSARTTGNPEWQGQVLLDGDFNQVDGTVGEVLMVSPNFKGTGALSYFTSSS